MNTPIGLPHTRTDASQRNTLVRRWHTIRHVDVDGTVTTLCGKRFKPTGGVKASTNCPVCSAVQALSEVEL